MTEENKCPQCGRALPADTPQGLCPACLFKRGLETNTLDETADKKHVRWTPPSVEELAEAFPDLDILEFIGRGGMGAVYKARQKELNRTVALKILPPEIGRDEAFAQRFTREAQAMARLNHPNIVTIHDFGSRSLTTGETPVPLYFFLMEYVDGLSLRQVLDAGGVEAKEALAIVPQICDALQYAHDNGIVHRDIKPENILLNQAGQVKIADFGLAKLVGSGLDVPSKGTTGVPPVEKEENLGRDAQATLGQDVQATQHVMGTPQYMAPEQIDRPADVDHRADIYSLGVVFYQMLTGELPKGKFQAPSQKVLIDVRLDEVVLRALEKDPSRRYQQVSEVKTQVETIVATAPVGRGYRPAQEGEPQDRGAVAPPYESSPSLSSFMPPTPEATRQINAAREAVRAPAIGLLVAGGINFAFFFVGFAILLIRSAGSQGTIVSWTLALPLLVGLILSFLVLCGALSMMRLRSRGWGIAGSTLAMFTWPGNILGLPMGIWALVVLSRRNIAEAFAACKTNKPTPSKWSAVWKNALSVLLVLLLVGLAMLVGRNIGFVPSSGVNPDALRSLLSGQNQPAAQPKQPQWRETTIPDADTKGIPVILDLPTGDLLSKPEKLRGMEALQYFTRLGKGDVGFDRVLFLLRGGKLLALDGKPLPAKEIKGDATAYDITSQPEDVIVRTGDGKTYRLKPLGVTSDGELRMKYAPTNERFLPVPPIPPVPSVPPAMKPFSPLTD